MVAPLREIFQRVLLVPVVVVLLGACGSPAPSSPWASVLDAELQAMGYRNWIVVGDAAFPVHARRGVRTLVMDGEIPEVLDGVLQSLDAAQRVSPRIYVARELAHVPNDRAPGIDLYRKEIEKAMHGFPARQMEYRSLSLLLEDSGKTFSVLVLKTRTALPYSSVFIELDSAYWDVESEREMRQAMDEANRQEPG